MNDKERFEARSCIVGIPSGRSEPFFFWNIDLPHKDEFLFQTVQSHIPDRRNDPALGSSCMDRKEASTVDEP